MRPVETILRMGGWVKENDGGVNLTKLYCKNFCKCHNVPWYNSNIIFKNFYRIKKQKKIIQEIKALRLLCSIFLASK
jgi:hypothetical protein